jgi:hypothetical protein
MKNNHIERIPERLVSIFLIFTLASLAVFPLFASEDGQTLFDQGIRLISASRAKGESAPPESKALFVRSAQIFETNAVSDWHFWYEAGNARWWSGQADRAIVDYRRYLEKDALRGEVWENLAQARLTAGTQTPGNEGPWIWPWYLWLASAAAFSGGISFFAFSLFLLSRKKSWRTGALFCAAFALCLGLTASFLLVTRAHIAVLTAQTQGYKGDSDAYAPWPAEPWKSGQEVQLLDIRDTWAQIRVGATISWVPKDFLSDSSGLNSAE